MMLRPLSYPSLGYAGRLGNQLWQIASTVGLARKNKMRPLFPSEWAYRPYFSCPNVWFGTPQPRMASPVAYAKNIDQRVRPYLQDLSLWVDVAADEVRQSFAPSALEQEIVADEWETYFAPLGKPFCALHVRRGDYVTNPNGTLTSLPISYYLEALDLINPDGEYAVAVFSDDIDWCQAQGLPGDVFYRGIARPKEQDPDYDSAPVLDWIDLFLQARCDAHVISNSTYSWWGAWLSSDPVNRKVYPSRWFGPEMSEYINFRAMIPEGWLEVKVDD